MHSYAKSQRLEQVRYEIRGPVYELAQSLELQGYKISKLNIGNPAPFGLETPDEIVHDIIVNLREAQGYSDSRGLFPARKAVMQYYQNRGLKDVQVEDIFIGNGVSELILLSLQALLNPGDEVLIPAPDYPLWTSAVALSGGKPVHYRCDEASDWFPDLADMAAKITPKTKALVLINPNNPTGAVYPAEVLQSLVQLAEAHKLVLFSDEIYDKILYDGAVHHPTALFAADCLCVTLSGLSKNYRAAGFRAGWLVLSGQKHLAKSYIEGLLTLASMRLCANVSSQFGIQTALGGYQSINDLVLPAGRLGRQRDLAYYLLTSIPGITCVKPKGAFYLFPKVDRKVFGYESDQQMVIDLLMEKKVLVVQGSGFNQPDQDHFRVVFLPPLEELEESIGKISDFFAHYRNGQVVAHP